MKSKRSFVRIAWIVIAVLLFSANAVSSSAQQPQTDPPGTGNPTGLPEMQAPFLAPAAGGSGIFTKSGLDFVPYLPSVTFARSGVGIYNTSGAGANFETHLNIPHGATIQRVVVYFYDNDPTNDLSADFNYHTFTDWGTYIFQEVNSSGASTAVRYAFANPTHAMRVVDGTVREYTVEVYLPPSSSVVLFSVRVDYGYDTALPVIVR